MADRTIRVKWLISPGIVNGESVKAGDVQELPDDDATKRYLAYGYVKLASDQSDRRPYEPGDNLGAIQRAFAEKVAASAQAAAEQGWRQ